MKIPETDINALRRKWILLSPQLDERSKRIWAGVEATAYGYGGVMLVHRATGLSRSTVKRGQLENQATTPVVGLERMRAVGGGLKRKD